MRFALVNFCLWNMKWGLKLTVLMQSNFHPPGRITSALFGNRRANVVDLLEG